MVHRISKDLEPRSFSGLETRGVYVLVFLPSICVTRLNKISCLDKPNHIPICTNKVLLAYSNTPLFVYCLWRPLCSSCKFSDAVAENTCVSPKAFGTVWSLAGNMPTWYWKTSEPLTIAHRAQLSFPRQQHNIKDKEIHLEKMIYLQTKT